MRIVELHAGTWRTAADVIDAIKVAIGAPKWHGSGIDALLDSMIYHDNINALKSPYTLAVTGLENATSEAREYAREVAQAINDAGISDRDTDLEIRVTIKS
jgi:hypothetical protein